MTKFILHGGGIRSSADEGKALFAEVVRGLGSKPKLLLCFFAQPPKLWQEKYDEWTRRIADSLPDTTPHFGMATAENFEEQSKYFDALYVYGGKSSLLIGTLSGINNNYHALLGRFKTVMGSSAGAIMLSFCAWDCDERKIVPGLALVPAKVLVHYQSESYAADDPRGPIDWRQAYRDLAAYGDRKLPVYELREGEFKVFRSDEDN